MDQSLVANGEDVRIASMDELEPFRANWLFHHKLEEAQIPYAGHVARIASIGHYHGGDVLYSWYLERVLS
jgi:hypothetical protein